MASGGPRVASDRPKVAFGGPKVASEEPKMATGGLKTVSGFSKGGIYRAVDGF